MDTPPGGGADSTPIAWMLGLAIALAGPVALIAARRHPGPVSAVVTAAAVADLFAPPAADPPYLALLFAIVGGIVRGARVWTYISVAAGWLVAVGVASLIGRPWNPFAVVVATAVLVLVIGASEGLRSRRDKLARARRATTERRQTAEQAERMRIAREIHDVLAHSLSQINVQAGVGLHLMDAQPDRAREALGAIKQTSKQALDEVRGVIDVLRASGESRAPRTPEHDLASLPGLIESFRAQGLDVSLDQSLDAVPSAAVQLAVFRIVQESLTNVLRHANAQRAWVSILRDGQDVVVGVRDDGAGSTGPISPGNGVLGMTERAELLGGSLSTGRAAAGGFLVEARLPMSPGGTP